MTPSAKPTPGEQAWMDYANCQGVDPDLFFPQRGESTSPAKAICAGCVVRDDCLDYALRTREPFGVWGGMSERQRRRLRARTALERAVS